MFMWPSTAACPIIPGLSFTIQVYEHLVANRAAAGQGLVHDRREALRNGHPDLERPGGRVRQAISWRCSPQERTTTRWPRLQ